MGKILHKRNPRTPYYVFSRLRRGSLCEEESFWQTENAKRRLDTEWTIEKTKESRPYKKRHVARGILLTACLISFISYCEKNL